MEHFRNLRTDGERDRGQNVLLNVASVGETTFVYQIILNFQLSVLLRLRRED